MPDDPGIICAVSCKCKRRHCSCSSNRYNFSDMALLKDGDRRAAALVALEALPSGENERPYVANAQYALSQALYSYDMGKNIQMERSLKHDFPVKSFHFTKDGSKIVSIDQGAAVYVWDAQSKKSWQRLHRK